ncbi:MAG: hypothetical protein ABI599_10305 [Flavobacteriales bacterium]
MTVDTLLQHLPHKGMVGDRNAEITEVQALDPANTRPGVLSWCSEKNTGILGHLRHGIVIAPISAGPLELPSSCTFIFCTDPRGAFRDAVNFLFPPRVRSAYRSSTAQVADNAHIGKDVHIGHNVVIEGNCVIGDGTHIGHNTVLLHGTIVGIEVSIGSNCTIGGMGFGYQPNADGDQELMPHLGNVVIGDKVEIGNNTCIDRGGLGSTSIGRNVKIDNLVHIAHNAVIGENSLIIAHAMVAGSCTIGANAWIAPNAAIRNKCNVGDNAMVGLGAVVTKDVAANAVVVGNPARQLEKTKG